MRTDNGLNKIDTWSYVHLFGSYFVATALALQIITSYPHLISILLTFLLGCLWEANDNRHKKWRLKNPTKALWLDIWAFDPRGASWLDIIMDAIGCLGALWVLS